MLHFSSHADRLRAKLLKKHSVSLSNQTAANNDIHHRHLFDRDPTNDDFQQIAHHDANVTQCNSSIVARSHGKTIYKINETNLISSNSWLNNNLLLSP